MKTPSDALASSWNSLLDEGHEQPGQYYRRLALDGIPAAYAGIVLPGACRRLSFSIERIQKVQSSEAMEKTHGYLVTSEQTQGNNESREFLHITEIDPGYGDFFLAVTSDLLSVWIGQSDAAAATGLVLRRLDHWHRFFQKEEGLGREGYLGLCGELLFLEQTLDWGLNPACAFEAWKGPLGDNQDFQYGHVAVEVKTTSGNSPLLVRISSTRQLDDTGLRELYLFHSALDMREAAGRTLKEIALSLEARIGQIDSPMGASVFREKLLSAGFCPELPGKYSSFGVTQRMNTAYSVGFGFPRILESSLPPGLSDVKYTLDLASCNRYETSLDLMGKALREASGHVHP